MTTKKKPKGKAKKPKPPMTLHCSRCSYVTHSGIAAMAKHCRKNHPKAMKPKK